MFSVKPFSKARVQRTLVLSLCSFTAVLALILAGCGGSSPTATASSTPHASTGSSASTGGNAPGIATISGYKATLFIDASSQYTAPDSVVVDGNNVFVDYQNVTAKDGSDNKTSNIVEYDMNGKQLKVFTASGHSDGMRMDPKTKLLWVTSNEDGNPKMETIDPANGTVTQYAFPKTPHGGGYDDVYFVNGMTFISASNPNLDKNGTNVFPALDKMTLDNGKVNLTPVLMGNASVTDTSTNPPSKVNINAIDPDSLSVDAKGNLVLVDQAGLELITISNPGTPQQSVTRIPTGSQFDDTVWATSSKGRLLVVDGSSNQLYWVSAAQYTVGTIFTQLPDDSGVTGLLGVVDHTTGSVAPIAIGFGKPTGMLFVPNI